MVSAEISTLDRGLGGRRYRYDELYIDTLSIADYILVYASPAACCYMLSIHVIVRRNEHLRTQFKQPGRYCCVSSHAKVLALLVLERGPFELGLRRCPTPPRSYAWGEQGVYRRGWGEGMGEVRGVK